VKVCGTEVLKVDMLTVASSDLGASGISAFDENVSLSCAGSPPAVEFKIFSPNPLNNNFNIHKSEFTAASI
jgi:hypothetical protein